MRRLSVVALLVCASGALVPSASAHHAPYLGIEASWGGEGSAPGQFSTGVEGVTTGPDGSVYALQTPTPGTVTRFDRDGSFLGRWGLASTGAADIAVGASGSVYVTLGDKVAKYSPSGLLLAEWDGTNGTPALPHSNGITTDAAGNVYVSFGDSPEDTGIAQVTEGGTFVQKVGNVPLLWLARDSDGFFYGPASTGGRIQRLAPTGESAGFIGFSPFSRELGHFAAPDGPRGVAVAADHSIWATDPSGYRVQGFSRDGALLDVCGYANRTDVLGLPNDVAPSGDAVVIADGVNIRRIGMVTHPATPCDAIPPKLTDIELLLKGGPRKWLRRSAVSFSTSKPSHARLKLQKRVRRHHHRRWRGLDRGRADLQIGENTLDFSDVLDVKPKPKAGRYRIKLRLDDEAGNLSRERKRKFRVP